MSRAWSAGRSSAVLRPDRRAAIAAAKAINSDRTAYVHLGFYDYDANGALTLYPPYIAAAMVAGAFAGSTRARR
jgi:hypothetical protein